MLGKLILLCVAWLADMEEKQTELETRISNTADNADIT